MKTSRTSNLFTRVLILFVVSMLQLTSIAQPKGVPVYDVIVVGGGPAGIGAALAAVETGAHTLLIERDDRIGGTTVQARVTDMGLFHAWKKQIIAGPVWKLVTDAVAKAGGSLPDFSKQEYNKWMESCVKVDPEIYSQVAEETLRKAGVELQMNVEVTSIERTE